MSIRNVTHHRLSQEDIRETGYDTDSLVVRRFEESKQHTEPRTWNTNVKTWGNLWSVVEYSKGVIEVEVGLSGCMTGVVVAKFDNRLYANLFAEDFVDHRVFALTGNDEWIAYVREANERRALGADRYIGLRALGRTEGLRIDGQSVTQAQLQALYARGIRV